MIKIKLLLITCFISAFLDGMAFEIPKFSGYLQAGYGYNSVGEGTSTFMIKKFRISMNAPIVDKAYIFAQVELFNGLNTGGRWENQKTIQVIDAYGAYKFSDALQVRVGQFNSPAGYENYLVNPANNQTIDYAPICTRMVCRNAIGYDYVDFGRDLGIMALGSLFKSSTEDFHHLTYNVAITNGHLPSVNDNNKSKDIMAALTFYPIKKFNVKLSYTWGEYTPDTFSGNLDNETYPWNQVQGNKYLPLNRVIVGAWYNDPDGLVVRSEYGHLSSSHSGIQLVKEDAFYLLAAYNIGKWCPVVRFDTYRDKINKTLPDNRERGLIGFNFQLINHLKIQANYLLSHYTSLAADATNSGHRYSSEVLIMGLFIF
ncbi:MAG: porin [Muribaculaceae bacterium]|nr:porin [Muribaculaceae bacterium]